MKDRLSIVRLYICCIATFLASFIFISAAAQDDVTYIWQVPKLNGYRVHDEANILTSATKQLLERQLKRHEDSTSNQIAILTISRLVADLEAYSLKVANEWKLGQKDKNNGVLILVVMYDHQIRIEVGLGLEKVLTNDLCSQIISNEIAPHFKKYKYDEGLKAAVSAIVKGIGGTYKVDKPEESDYELEGWIMYSIVIFFSIFGFISRNYFSTIFGATLPFHIFFTAYEFINWWVLLGIVAGLPLLRFVLKKSKVKFFKFGSTDNDSNDDGDDSGEDAADRMERRRRRKSLERSSSDSSDRFSGGGGSFGGKGSSGRW